MGPRSAAARHPLLCVRVDVSAPPLPSGARRRRPSLLASSCPRRFPHPIRPPGRLLTAGAADSPEIPRDSARIRGSSRRSTANRRGSGSWEVRPPLLIAKARCLVPAAWGVGLGACARRFPVAGGASRCGERMNLLGELGAGWVGFDDRFASGRRMLMRRSRLRRGASGALAHGG